MVRSGTNDIACHRVLLSFTEADVAYILETAPGSYQLLEYADIASASRLDDEGGLTILLMYGPVCVDWVDLDRWEIQIHTLGDQSLNHVLCFIVDCNLEKKRDFQKLAQYFEWSVNKFNLPA